MRIKNTWKIWTAVLACMLFLAFSLPASASAPGEAAAAEKEVPGAEDARPGEGQAQSGRQGAGAFVEALSAETFSMKETPAPEQGDAESASPESSGEREAAKGPANISSNDFSKEPPSGGNPSAEESKEEALKEIPEEIPKEITQEITKEIPKEDNQPENGSPTDGTTEPEIKPPLEQLADASNAGKPETVRQLTVTPEDFDTFCLTWQEAADASGYELYYSSAGDGEYKFLKALTGNSYRFKEAVCGVPVYFKIRAFRWKGEKTLYGALGEAISGTTVLQTPKPYVSKITCDQITFRWPEVAGALGYRLLTADTEKGPYRELARTERNIYTQEAEFGKTFYYKVVAVRGSYETPEAESEALAAAAAFESLSGLNAAGINTGSIRLSWKKVLGVEKYIVTRYSSQKDAEAGTNPQRKIESAGCVYVDTELAENTTYYYKVYGVKGMHQTAVMGPVQAKTQKKAAPSPGGSSGSMRYGIDVSAYQGDINWNAAADSGIEFAMLRVLVRSGSKDAKFERNYQNARAAGVKVGVYRYSYARSVADAEREAREVVSALAGRRLDYPVALDMEDNSQLNLSRELKADMIRAYKRIIEAAGYRFVLYANTNWLTNQIDMSGLSDVEIWLARWRSLNLGPGYNGNVTMWQYSDKGSVPGISGNVDLNVSYKKY